MAFVPDTGQQVMKDRIDVGLDDVTRVMAKVRMPESYYLGARLFTPSDRILGCFVAQNTGLTEFTNEAL